MQILNDPLTMQSDSENSPACPLIEPSAHEVEARDILAVIVSSSDDAIISKTLDGVITSWNPAAEKLFGYTAAEIIGQPILVLIPAERVHEEKTILARIGQGKRIKSFETVRLCKNGKAVEVSVTISPILDGQGKVMGASKIARDITERKESETRLRESEESFRTMANSIAQLAWTAKPDGFIFWYNQRWYDYTGTTPEQMEGWGWQSVHDPQVLPRVMSEWTGVIAAGEPFDTEFPLRGADGKFRRFLTRAIPIKNTAGKVIQWFGTNTDVDELKRAEEEVSRLNLQLEQRVIERTAQLQEANKALDAFSYSISHDLRAPLRAVDGYSKMIVEDYADNLDSEGLRMLGTIRSESRRMGQLIDDLLAFSRLGRQEIRLAPIDMTMLVRSVFNQIAAAHPERKLNLELQALPAATGELSMIRQVWVNLISNAVKFTKNMESAEIEIGGSKDEGQLHYFVRDNGAGFDMRFAGKLYGVFQRLHSEAEFECTGVGLALVQRIVERHGGRTWAEGKINQGASIYFVLPNKNL